MSIWKNRSKNRTRRSATSRYGLEFELLEHRNLFAGLQDLALDQAQWSPAALTSSVETGEGSNAGIAFIVNGQQTSGYPSVGLVNGGCTGTLISPTHVLTAAHCVENNNGGFMGNRDGTFQVNGQTYRTIKITPHPRYNSNNFGAGYDLAIMKLDRPVIGVTPSEINRTIPQVGQILTLVGFGQAGTSSNPSYGFGVKHVGTTPIDSITNEHISWTLDNTNEASTTPGDSGGPAFINAGGKLVIAGVTSGGSSDSHSIGADSFDTRVDTLAGWIDANLGPVSSAPIVSVKSLDASAAETSVGQAVNTGSFVISRTGPSTAPLTVSLTMSGSATNGADYTRVPSSVTIPAGSNSVVVTIRPIDDSLVEPTDAAVLTVSAGSGYLLDNAFRSTTVSISDNDVNTSNDLFANRQRINGAVATVTGSNLRATRETGEPNIAGVSGSKSVWWTWKALASGRVTISTAGSSFDTTLGVYKGNSVNALSRVATNDDNPQASDYTSLLRFNAVAGQTYQIAVDGYDGDAGSIKLSLNQIAGHSFGNNRTFDPTNAISGRQAQLSQSNRDEVFWRLFQSTGRAQQARGDHQQPIRQVSSQRANLTVASFDSDESDVQAIDTFFADCMAESLDNNQL